MKRSMLISNTCPLPHGSQIARRTVDTDDNREFGKTETIKGL